MSNTTSTTGCDNSGGGQTIDPSFDTFKFIITAANPTCVGADCHGNNPANPLNLTIDDGLYTRLMAAMSQACGNIPVVTPGNPDQSALVMLLKGPCGSLERMPRGCNDLDCNCIPDNYVAAIEQWVANGAPEQ